MEKTSKTTDLEILLERLIAAGDKAIGSIQPEEWVEAVAALQAAQGSE